MVCKIWTTLVIRHCTWASLDAKIDTAKPHNFLGQYHFNDINPSNYRYPANGLSQMHENIKLDLVTINSSFSTLYWEKYLCWKTNEA